MPSLICSLRSTAAATAFLSLRAALRCMRRETVERELDGCQMVAGFWCHSLTFRQIRCLLGALPNPLSIVAKNTLLGNSTEGTSCACDMNAWLFVRSEGGVAATLKACRDFQREWKLHLNDFTGAAFEGRLYGPQDFGVLDSTSATAESNGYCLDPSTYPQHC